MSTPAKRARPGPDVEADFKRDAELDAEFDVVIVGYGPVGATLANLLGMHGHRVLVLEREAAMYHLPRAVHFDEEVMRVFQTIGLAHRVEKVVRVNPGMRFVDDSGSTLLDWPRPSGIGPSGWHSSYRFHQPDLEQILRNGVERYANVTVRSQCEFTGCIDSESFTDVEFTDVRTNQCRQVGTRYLVGCDGGRSTVRQMMQSDVEDLGFRESWLVVDVLLNQPMEQLGDFTIQFCNTRQPATYVRCPANRRRWEIAMPARVTPADVCQPEAVWRLLKDWIKPSQATLERSVVYTFHSMIAKQWRCGRTLIAGDAAHQMPPFMGQGMCAGIRDVVNLGWKLHRCISRGNSDQLLDSYQSERYPHVRAYIDTAIELGTLLNSCETAEALRSAMSNDSGTPTMKSIAPRLGHGLTYVPNSAASRGCTQDEHAGTLAPQVLRVVDDVSVSAVAESVVPDSAISDKTILDNAAPGKAAPGIARLDDRVGYHPVLLIDDELLDVVAAVDLYSVQVESVSANNQLAKILTDLKARAVLVRPDRYIYGCANTHDELVDLLGAATQAMVI